MAGGQSDAYSYILYIGHVRFYKDCFIAQVYEIYKPTTQIYFHHINCPYCAVSKSNKHTFQNVTMNPFSLIICNSVKASNLFFFYNIWG